MRFTLQNNTSMKMPLFLQLFAEQLQKEVPANDEEVQKEEENGNNEQNDLQQQEKKYTDKEVNDFSKKNSVKAVKKFMKELGITDLEKAKEILKSAQQKEETEKSGDDNVNELSTALEQSNQKITETNKKLATALLKNHLLSQADFDKTKVDRAIHLISYEKMIDDEGKIDEELIKNEVSSLLSDFPEFKNAQENKGFKIGSDGKEDSGKTNSEIMPNKKRWNRFNH